MFDSQAHEPGRQFSQLFGVSRICRRSELELKVSARFVTEFPQAPDKHVRRVARRTTGREVSDSGPLSRRMRRGGERRSEEPTAEGGEEDSSVHPEDLTPTGRAWGLRFVPRVPAALLHAILPRLDLRRADWLARLWLGELSSGRCASPSKPVLLARTGNTITPERSSSQDCPNQPSVSSTRTGRAPTAARRCSGPRRPRRADSRSTPAASSRGAAHRRSRGRDTDRSRR